MQGLCLLQAANPHGNVRGCRLAVSDPRFAAQTPVTDCGLATTPFRGGPEGLGIWPSRLSRASGVTSRLPAVCLPGGGVRRPGAVFIFDLTSPRATAFSQASPCPTAHRLAAQVILDANRSHRFRERHGTPSWLTSMPWPVLDGEHRWFHDGHLQDGLGGEGPVNIRHTPMTPLVSAEAGMMADSCKNTAENSCPWMERPCCCWTHLQFLFYHRGFFVDPQPQSRCWSMVFVLSTPPLVPSFPFDSPIIPSTRPLGFLCPRSCFLLVTGSSQTSSPILPRRWPVTRHQQQLHKPGILRSTHDAANPHSAPAADIHHMRVIT